MLIPYITQKRDLNYMVKSERAKEEKFEKMMEVFFLWHEFFFNVDGQSAELEKFSLATKMKSNWKTSTQKGISSERKLTFEKDFSFLHLLKSTTFTFSHNRKRICLFLWTHRTQSKILFQMW